MDITDSFVNWGFNPSFKNEGTSKYALIWGGANPDDGDSYTGIINSNNLKSLLKKLWSIWTDYNSYKIEEPEEYIEEDGDNLSFSDENGLISPLYLSKYSSNHGVKKEWKKPYKFIGTPEEENLLRKKEELSDKTIWLQYLTETMPYDEQIYGDLDEAPDFSMYVEDCERAYKQYIDGLNLKNYENKLDEVVSEKEDKTRGWHNNIIIVEFRYTSDYSCATWKVVRLGNPLK